MFQKSLLPTVFIFLAIFCFSNSYSQNTETSEAEFRKTSYAYITVNEKPFSKKLNVLVDLGESEEQKSMANKYSTLLSKKESYAAVLNFMESNGFELIQSFALPHVPNKTDAVIFVMKKISSKY